MKWIFIIGGGIILWVILLFGLTAWATAGLTMDWQKEGAAAGALFIATPITLVICGIVGWVWQT